MPGLNSGAPKKQIPNSLVFKFAGLVAESSMLMFGNYLFMPLNTLRLWLFLTLATLSASAAVLIPTDSDWKYLKGTAEASAPDPTQWRTVGFDDSLWSTGQGAFYYETQPGSATAYTGNTALSDMSGNYSCLFMRRTFVVNNVNELSELQLSALSDDGFRAWINGTNVADFNMPGGEIPFDGASLGALTEPVPVQVFTIANPRSFLVNGTNVLVVQAFNSSLGASSDFVINVSLSGTTDTTRPTVANLIPLAAATVRSLTSIEVDFSEDVTGVEAADLLINGVPATGLTML